MSIISIPIEILPHGKDLPVPLYATSESSGFDLRAAIEGTVIIEPFSRYLVPCGFSMKIPTGFEGQIRSRSGLSLKNGIAVLNSPGTIDADYTGEIKVILINHGSVDFELTRGLRCAQMVICPIQRVSLNVVPQITEINGTSQSQRSSLGFGSTGLD